MFDVGRIAAFAVAAFVVIVIPGPSVLFAIGQAVAYGRRAAIVSVVGNACGVYVQALFVAIGVGALVERSIAVFTVLKLAGAAYLIVLGMQAIIRRGTAAVSSAVRTVPAARRRFRDGFGVGVTNPKGFALFSAILPQFVDRAAGYVPIQMLFLALIAMLIAVLSDSAWAALAGAGREWLAKSPRRAERLQLSGGVMMVGLGVDIAVSRRHS
jgi:threonine/homoserine/homoserine lactone efflux protein